MIDVQTPPRGGRAAGPEVNCNALDKRQFIDPEAARQAPNPHNPRAVIDAADITCAAMRRVELLARLGGLLEIVAVNAEAAALSLRIADDRGGRYHFNEAWDSIQDAGRGFAELRALSGSHKEPSR